MNAEDVEEDADEIVSSGDVVDLTSSKKQRGRSKDDAWNLVSIRDLGTDEYGVKKSIITCRKCNLAFGEWIGKIKVEMNESMIILWIKCFAAVSLGQLLPTRNVFNAQLRNSARQNKMR